MERMRRRRLRHNTANFPVILFWPRTPLYELVRRRVRAVASSSLQATDNCGCESEPARFSSAHESPRDPVLSMARRLAGSAKEAVLANGFDPTIRAFGKLGL